MFNVQGHQSRYLGSEHVHAKFRPYAEHIEGTVTNFKVAGKADITI